LACLVVGRAETKAFLLDRSLSFPLAFVLEFLLPIAGCSVSSESVSTRVGDIESDLLVLSFRVLPVFGLSLIGLATDSAYLSVPSMTFPESSASATDAILLDRDVMLTALRGFSGSPRDAVEFRRVWLCGVVWCGVESKEMMARKGGPLGGDLVN
jgi:hypothetical protein